MTARRLDAADEPAFQRLLTTVYGDSYAYRDLYAPGGYARLLARGDVVSWGDVADDGELHSHTAFLCKDPRQSYVESGLSLRNPSLASNGRTPDHVVWEALLGEARELAPLLHQNTTTQHPLAQRYARRHMRARPTGFIVDYAVGEHIVGMPPPGGPMQALTMTTVLRDDTTARPTRAPLPSTPYSNWLSGLLASWGVEAVDAAPSKDAAGLDPVEWNSAIDLRRRAVSRASRATDATDGRAPRTDLIHVPCDERLATLAELVERDYVPVGVRPQRARPVEVVLQCLPHGRRQEARARLRAASLVGDDARALVRAWCDLP